MYYFHGFSLRDEEHLFRPYIVQGAYNLVGFSYGAQKALEYALECDRRIQRIILLSPAFFQNEKASFKRAQLRYFDADPKAYTSQFLQNVTYPSQEELSEYLLEGSRAELEDLLHYQWEAKKITLLLEKGIEIEVFLGEEDKIINAKDAFDFFAPLTTTYLLKNVGHLLV